METITLTYLSLLGVVIVGGIVGKVVRILQQTGKNRREQDKIESVRRKIRKNGQKVTPMLGIHVNQGVPSVIETNPSLAAFIAQEWGTLDFAESAQKILLGDNANFGSLTAGEMFELEYLKELHLNHIHPEMRKVFRYSPEKQTLAVDAWSGVSDRRG